MKQTVKSGLEPSPDPRPSAMGRRKHATTESLTWAQKLVSAETMSAAGIGVLSGVVGAALVDEKKTKTVTTTGGYVQCGKLAAGIARVKEEKSVERVGPIPRLAKAAADHLYITAGALATGAAVGLYKWWWNAEEERLPENDEEKEATLA